MNILPILENHNSENVIGKCEAQNNKWILTFNNDQRITKEMLLNSLNGAMKIIESFDEDGIEYIKKVEVFELSISKP